MKIDSEKIYEVHQDFSIDLSKGHMIMAPIKENKFAQCVDFDTGLKFRLSESSNNGTSINFYLTLVDSSDYILVSFNFPLDDDHLALLADELKFTSFADDYNSFMKNREII